MLDSAAAAPAEPGLASPAAALEAALVALRPLEATDYRAAALATIEECRRIARLKLGPPAPAPPLAVVAGGTNVGKTTVANALSGAVLGRPTPLARGTKAAVLYVSQAAADAFRRGAFLPGYERRDLGEPAEANEEALAGTLLVLPHPPGAAALDAIALADSPDIDSVFGKNRRVAWDLLYAADALVFVASEEKYNDEVCVRFLAQAARHGKRIFAVLNKSAAPEAAEDFRRQVVPRATAGAPPDAPPAEVFTIPWLGPGAQAGAAFAPVRAALAGLAEDGEEAVRRARAGAARALEEELRPALETLRREAELLEHYRAEAREIAAAAARSYRGSLATLPILEFDRVLRLLADALRVPVLDDFYARLREAGRPIGGFVRRALGLADPQDGLKRRIAARDQQDVAAARVILGEALGAVRRLADRYPPDLANALRAALLPAAAAERLHDLDGPYAASLGREADAWTDGVLRDLHAKLRTHRALVAVIKTLKGILRAGAAATAIALTGHLGLEDLAIAPAIDLLVKTGVEAGIDRAYFARKRDAFYDARAAVFERAVLERVEALALARLGGTRPEAIAHAAEAARALALAEGRGR
jgi:hypothetical protein